MAAAPGVRLSRGFLSFPVILMYNKRALQLMLIYLYKTSETNNDETDLF